MKETENLSSSSLFHLYFWKWAGPSVSCFWGWLLSYLFRCCDTDRNTISQGYNGIHLQATSLLVFRVGSFKKLNFSIRGSLCQAKIYQGIPEKTNSESGVTKYLLVIQFTIHYLLIFLSLFIQCCLSVLLPASQSYFLPSSPTDPSYLSPQCFHATPLLIVSCPKILSSACFLQRC